MNRIIRARFSDGVIVPLEKLEIEEGEELTVIVTGPSKRTEGGTRTALDKTVGGWKKLVDGKTLKDNIYADRLVSSRPRPKL